ncbi:MAG TPA: hypothetical protein VGK62_08255 [Gaiellaceae bacterium]
MKTKSSSFPHSPPIGDELRGEHYNNAVMEEFFRCVAAREEVLPG